jgi:beta-phosphoglucomutase-like phosphatase (HAD superfamily)
VEALRNIDYPKAILFDCDGVLVDTEKDGHRIAFNEAFKRKSGLSLVNVRLFQSYYSMPTKRFRTCQNLLRLCYCVR